MVSLCVPSGPGIVVAGPLSIGRAAGRRSSLFLLGVDFDLFDARLALHAILLELQAVHVHLLVAGRRFLGQHLELFLTLNPRVSEISLVQSREVTNHLLG